MHEEISSPPAHGAEGAAFGVAVVLLHTIQLETSLIVGGLGWSIIHMHLCGYAFCQSFVVFRTVLSRWMCAHAIALSQTVCYILVCLLGHYILTDGVA